MCDPLTIAGIALTAGSTIANTIGANRVQKARDDALAAERIRQRQLDQEAEALNVGARDRYENFEGKQEEKASQLGDYFTEQAAEAGAGNAAAAQSMLPTSGSAITVREEAKQRAGAKDFTDQQGQALGQMRSFGDLLGGIGRNQARDATTIGQIGGFKKGSSGIVPLELEAANSAGDGAKFFGDLMGLGGSLAMNAGLSSAKPDPWSGMRSIGTKPSSGLVRLFGS